MAQPLIWERELPDLPAELLEDIRATGVFQEKTIPMVAAAKLVLSSFPDDRLTIRQLYYQMVARGYVWNKLSAYKSLSLMLTKARKNDVVRWQDFEDRARRVVGEFDDSDPTAWRPQSVAHAQVEDGFTARLHEAGRWQLQDAYLEVWVEKDALAGFMEPVCNEWGVALVVSRGYTSYTFRREAIERLRYYRTDHGRRGVVLYFGDLDPSGWDIYRLMADELEGVADVQRPALNVDQVAALDLPPMPQKNTDSRYAGFQKMFPQLGQDCYELDALDPRRLKELLAQAIMQHYCPDRAEEARRLVAEWQARYEEELADIRRRVLGR